MKVIRVLELLGSSCDALKTYCFPKTLRPTAPVISGFIMGHPIKNGVITVHLTFP